MTEKKRFKPMKGGGGGGGLHFSLPNQHGTSKKRMRKTKDEPGRFLSGYMGGQQKGEKRKKMRIQDDATSSETTQIERLKNEKKKDKGDPGLMHIYALVGGGGRNREVASTRRWLVRGGGTNSGLLSWAEKGLSHFCVGIN